MSRKAFEGLPYQKVLVHYANPDKIVGRSSIISEGFLKVV